MYKYKYNNEEYFSEFDMTDVGLADWLRSLGVLNNPGDTSSVSIDVEYGYTSNGQLHYRKINTRYISPFNRARTREEYEKELKEILSEIPAEFHSFVENFAYEHGHASGYDEVLGIANDLTSGLKPCIQKFVTEFRYEFLEGYKGDRK